MAQIFSPSGEWRAYAFEAIAVGASAVGPTGSLITQSDGKDPVRARRARAALLSVETNSVRYRIDGTDPTAGVGHLLLAGDSVIIEGVDNVARLRLIQASAGATVAATYFRTS